MRLAELIGGLDGRLAGDGEVEVSGLAYRADAVAEGDLYFCVRGFSADGHEFAGDAVSRGAAALVVDHALELGVPEVRVADVRAAMGPVASRYHGDPTARLAVCGITGTNGKTTTAFLLRHLLEAGGRRCGLLGTVKRIVGGSEEEAVRTTPEAIDLQAIFARMLEAGDETCAMEVSSHALELGRVDSIRFDCAVFTNLTQDHLDFHPDMASYFAAKRRLFEAGPRARIVNIDDPYGRELSESGDTTYSAAGEAADYRALDVRFDTSGANFRLVAPEGELEVSTSLPGDFNVANALAAIAAAREMGVPLDTAAPAVAGAGRVPGRFEPVEEGQPFAVYVDYAHTPDSLENVLAAARRLTVGRVICVFGCGGDRDRGKRPLMGEVGARLADVAVVTSDNPRSEEPEAIIREILGGMATAEPLVEPDRRAAIALALREAREGDSVVIAGKGHEQGQEFEDGRKVPFDDRDVARDELRALLAKAP